MNDSTENRKNQDIRMVHVADLHLGFTGREHLTVKDGVHAGRQLREVDIEEAVQWLTETIVALQPRVDVVLVAGDLFHRPNPLPRAVATAARMVASLRQHGMEVVIIDGNHDASSRATQGSPAQFLEEFGAVVVSGGVRVLDQWQAPHLKRLLVHAVPSTCGLEALEACTPRAEKCNVLLAHGPHQNNPGYTHGLCVPTEVLVRGWNYVALGDCHAHHHQPSAAAPAWYAGSLQALGFSEARFHPARPEEPYARGGFLLVTVPEYGEVHVESVAFPGRRPVLKLRDLNAEGWNSGQVLDEIESHLQGLPPEAMITFTVRSCTPQLRAQMDHSRYQGIKSRYAWLEVSFEPQDDDPLPSSVPPQEQTLTQQWATYLQDNITESEEARWLLERGRELLEASRQEIAFQDAEAQGETA